MTGPCPLGSLTWARLGAAARATPAPKSQPQRRAERLSLPTISEIPRQMPRSATIAFATAVRKHKPRKSMIKLGQIQNWKWIRGLRLAAAVHSFISSMRAAHAWRTGWDSNPRGPCGPAGFQDRCLKPLGHPSTFSRRALNRARGLVKGRIATRPAHHRGNAGKGWGCEGDNRGRGESPD